MLRKGQLVLDTPDEMDVLMEFALHELRRQGKSPVELYRREHRATDPVEEELLAALVKARTGLYQVERVVRRRRQLVLRSLLKDDVTLTLTNIGASRSGVEGMIFFLRPLRLPGFTMGSGVFFVFPEEVRGPLLVEWRRKRRGNLPNSALRFIDFFHLSQNLGIPVEYRKPLYE